MILSMIFGVKPIIDLTDEFVMWKDGKIKKSGKLIEMNDLSLGQ